MTRRKLWLSRSGRIRREAGFTLLEILVALGIVAVGITAYVSAMSSSIDDAGTIETRVLSSWIASNQFAVLHLEHAWPASGETDGQGREGGRVFYYQQVVSMTNDPTIRKVDITVFTDEARRRESGHMFGYLGKPGAPGG